MTIIRQIWQSKAEPFTSVVDDVQDWTATSPCEGWTAADVLDHVVDTEREFLTGQGIDLPGDPAVRTAEHGSGDPAARWHAHLAAVDALVADDDVASRGYDGVFGPTTIGDTLTSIYGFDLLVHRWDLARSQGRAEQLTPAELAEIDAAVDGWGEHAYAPGIFARPVEVPPGAEEQVRVLARTGRRA